MDSTSDSWMAAELRRRASEYRRWENGRVFVGTWNVNNKGPPSDSVPEWLHQEGGIIPDVYALGLQEVDLTAAGLVSKERVDKIQPWIDCLSASVNTAHHGVRYELIGSKQMVGLLLVVFVRLEARRHVSDVSLQTVGTGFMGVMGNKGAVALSMRYYDTSLCFVNAHLAAGESSVDRRNQDYQEITRRLSFGSDPAGEGGVGLFDHHYVFWFGDLNYRLNTTMSIPQACDASTAGKNSELRRLLTLDQLVQLRAANIVFQGFTEPPITFPPTYKFVPGTHTYTDDQGEKLRLPAWCDRIMYLVRPADPYTLFSPQTVGVGVRPLGTVENGTSVSTEEYLGRHGIYPGGIRSGHVSPLDRVQASVEDGPLSPEVGGMRLGNIPCAATFPQKPLLLSAATTRGGEACETLCYESIYAHALTMSDHKPVRSTFLIRVPITDNEALQKVREDVARRLDALENGCLPQITLSSQFVDFGKVELNVVSKRTVTLQNTGSGPLDWVMVPKPGASTPTPPWLHVSPINSHLEVGESVTLTFSLFVNDDLAGPLNTGDSDLDDILVLHLRHGRDHYLSVRACWTQTAFACTIRELLEESRKVSPGARVPLHLWWLVHLVSTLGQGLQTPSLFVCSGVPSEVELIASCLDSPVNELNEVCRGLLDRAGEFSAHSAAEVLLRFLGSLSTPVFPTSAFSAAVQCQTSDQAVAVLTDSNLVPPTHYCSALYVVSLIRRVLSACRSSVGVDQLCLVFASHVLRSDGEPQPTKACHFLKLLVTAE